MTRQTGLASAGVPAMARTPSSNREISLAAPCVLAVLVSIFVAQASLSAVALPTQESASHDQNAAPANPEEITELELEKSIERELSAGQKHRYQVKLSAGQFMKTEIRDHGTDVGVVIHFPNGDRLNPWLPVAQPFDVKPVSHLAETAGIYSLDVYASARAVTGRYEIRLTELRTANEDDRALQEARNLFRDYVRIRDQGRWIEAGPYLRRVLEIRERILGQQNLLVATTLGFMANHYDNTGNYANAESYGLRALTIKETLLGPDHPEVAHEYFSMSVIYRNRGDYSKTEELQHKGLAILEKAHKSQSPMAAALLEGLGSVRYELHDYQGAEEYTQQGRAIWEKLLGADNYHLAPSYTFLGRVAYDRADYAKAETMFQKALSLGETGLGKDHLKVTKYRNDLAMLYCTTGDYPRGEALYRQSLAVHEQKAAMSHPAVQETLFGLARCYAAQGNAPDALLIQSRASEMEERYVAVNLAVGSEREKQAFLASLSSRSWRNISLHTRVVPADPVARDLAITTVLQSKGRVQDAMSASLSGLRQHLSADDQKLLDRLNDVTAKLASLVLNGPQKVPAAEYQQQIKALEDQREGLEDEIHHRSAGFYAASKPVTLAAIQAAVPGEAALIEFAVYRPFDPRAANDQKAYGAPRYVAYVVRNQGPVQWAELGAAAPIDRSIDNLREALRDPHRKDVQRLARAVDAQVMQPVRSLLGSAAQLLISPDGELNLIPFGALVDEQGHYLTERYFISYLTAGRDLLRMQVQRESKGAPVVIADPYFGDPRSVQVARSDVNYTRPIPSPSKRRSITAGDDLAAVYFAPLRGTAA